MSPVRFYVARRTGTLPSCFRWWGFDAENLSAGPVTGSRRTKAEIEKDLRDSGATVITEAQAESLPLYVRLRTEGETFLSAIEEREVHRLRAIAKAEGLELAIARQKRYAGQMRGAYRPLRAAVVIPLSGGLIARYPTPVETVKTSDLL